MDLSPDQDTLLVADADASAYVDDPHNQVFVLDLVHRRTSTLRFAIESLESGTFLLLFVSPDTFLLTSSFAGDGLVPLREVSVTTGAYAELRKVTQNTMLARSADGTTVAMAESNISSGPVERYSLADQSFERGDTRWFVYEVAVNRDATQFAVPVYGGLFVYSYAGGFDTTPVELGTYMDHFAVGAVYSPDSDVLYVSWTDVSGDNGSIEALDSTSFQSLFTLDSEPGLESNGNYAFVSGRLRIAPSGNMVGATVKNGVRLYPAWSPG